MLNSDPLLPTNNCWGFGSLSPKKEGLLVGNVDSSLSPKQKKRSFRWNIELGSLSPKKKRSSCWNFGSLSPRKKCLFVGILNWDPLLPTKTCWDVGMSNSDLVHLLLMSSTISNSPCHFIAGPPPPPFAIRVRVARHQRRPPPQNRILSRIQFVSLPRLTGTRPTGTRPTGTGPPRTGPPDQTGPDRSDIRGAEASHQG